jgi:hypothetical protein
MEHREPPLPGMNTGGDCVVYSSNHPRPPWRETQDCRDLELCLGLLAHPDPRVAQLAVEVVGLYEQCRTEGSTVARQSLGQGIGERMNTLAVLGFAP